MGELRILFLGDIVGKPGRRAVREHLARLRRDHRADLVIANGENAAGGVGIDPGTADEIFGAGVDVITTGNHIWAKRDVYPYLDKNSHRMVRPYNCAPGAPGAGAIVVSAPDGTKVGVLNLLARVFMPDLVDCPFRAADRALSEDLAGAKVIFVDFHGEATSEKVAMGYYLDGRATVMVGTHTHVQTADERVLPRGLAYISDAGMCGPAESVIGVEVPTVLEKFVGGRPTRFEVAGGAPLLNGVIVSCDPATGRATSITRVLERH